MVRNALFCLSTNVACRCSCIWFIMSWLDTPLALFWPVFKRPPEASNLALIPVPGTKVSALSKSLPSTRWSPISACAIVAADTVSAPLPLG